MGSCVPGCRDIRLVEQDRLLLLRRLPMPAGLLAGLAAATAPALAEVFSATGLAATAAWRRGAGLLATLAAAFARALVSGGFC